MMLQRAAAVDADFYQYDRCRFVCTKNLRRSLFIQGAHRNLSSSQSFKFWLFNDLSAG
jgi:hypothetical protein